MFKRSASLLVAIGVSCGIAAGARMQPTFFQQSPEPALLGYEMAMGMVGGAAVSDIDRDADPDIFLASGLNRPSQVLLNRGDGTFDVTTLSDREPHNDRAGLWLDFDGDRDLDLLVLADNHFQSEPTETTNLRLYQNTGERLIDVTSGAGLHKLLQRPDEHPDAHLSHGSGLVAADFNADGAIDFYVTFWAGRNYLFLNNADGTFRDASAASGIQEWNTYWQPGVHDFDADGDMDIVQPVDFTENRFYINNGDGTFTDVAPALGLDNAWNDMGIAIGDPDNDGDFDVFITNIHDQFTPLSDLQGRHNVYYQNESALGGLAFVERAEAMRVATGDWGWGCTFVDVDHDGWQDIAQTNGFNVNPARGFATDRTRLFYNQRNGTPFIDIAQAAGCDDTRIGTSYVAFDADRDGDQDLLQTCQFEPATLSLNRLEQTGVPNNWIRIRPRSVVPGSSGHANHFAIGAVVRVQTSDPAIGTQSRLITAGTSLLGQEPADAHFGMGAAVQSAGTVTVEWPNGLTTAYQGLSLNSVVTVVDATRTDADLDNDGALTTADIAAAFREPFDLSGDLIYSHRDIAMLIRRVLLQPGRHFGR